MSRRKRHVRVAVYIHASAQEPQAVVEQRRRCRELAEVRGWQVVREVVDLDKSRTQRDWSGLDGVMLDVRDGHVDGVVVDTLERLGHSSGAIARRVGEMFLRNVQLSASEDGVDGTSEAGALVQAALAKLWAVDRAKAARIRLDEQAAAAARGVPLGRPRVDVDVGFVLQQVLSGVSYMKLGKTLGRSPNTLKARVREELARRASEKAD